jgi:hypothetical protein
MKVATKESVKELFHHLTQEEKYSLLTDFILSLDSESEMLEDIEDVVSIARFKSIDAEAQPWADVRKELKAEGLLRVGR